MQRELTHLLFFFNDTATTEIYTLSLHDALPISPQGARNRSEYRIAVCRANFDLRNRPEEHTSELQSRLHLVCRLLLEKKKRPTASSLASSTQSPRSERPSFHFRASRHVCDSQSH